MHSLHRQYPLVAQAVFAKRTVRSDGRRERHIWLYDSSDFSAKWIGRCTEPVMQKFVDAGFWRHQSAIFTDHQPDIATETWWLDTDD